MSLAFGFALPHWQPLSGGFSPASLFEGGTVAGAWYDPSDLSTMFDSSAGTTPVAMPGLGSAVPVGLMLDKSQGLVLGSELVTNGDFSSGTTGWTGVAPDGGTAVLSVVSGELELTNTTTQGARAVQGITTVIGRWYKVTLVARNSTAFNASLRITNDSQGASPNIALTSTTSLTNTTLTVTFLATATTTYVTLFAGYASGPIPVVYFDNISVRELPGNHAIAANDSTKRPVLMARVNLLTYSEQFDNGAWTKSGLNAFGSGSVANTTATLDPLGGNTADFIQENTALAEHSVSQTASNVGVNYIFTCYAKGGGRAFVRLKYFDSANNRYGAVFDLSTGVATNDPNTGSGVIVSSAALSAGNGWWRLTITGNAPTIANATFAISMATSATTTNQPSVSYTGDGTSGIYIWGADLRPANIGANVPAYQRIADANTYDTSGFPLYLRFDGIDDSMYTPANLDLSGTDKATVFAGVRKLADTRSSITELSADAAASNGSFNLFASVAGAARWFSALRGTAFAYYEPQTYTAPITNVLSTSFDIAGASISNEIVPRVNGIVEQDNPSGANAGTGNFGTHPLYIGSRSNSSDWFNGQVYGLLVVGSAVSAGNISATEQWVAGKTGITI